MNQHLDTPVNKTKEKISLSLLISVGFHAVLILILGGTIIFPGYVSKTPFIGQMLTQAPDVEMPPMPEDMPEVLEEPSGGGGMGSDESVDLSAPFTESADSLADIDTITSISPNLTYSVPSASGSISVSDALSKGAFGSGGGTGGGHGPGIGKGVGGGKGTSLFGSFSEQERGEGLEGTFYDLKQTSIGKPSGVDPNSYMGVARKFLLEGWKFTDREFYTASRKLYATNFTISQKALQEEVEAKTGQRMKSANAAPYAFGVEKEVDARCWFIHYTGYVKATASGEYRFGGKADDYIAVRVNDNPDLAAYAHNNMGKADANSLNPISDWQPKSNFSYCHGGDWLSFKKGERIKMDILIGERPGNDFYSTLVIQFRKNKSEKEVGTGFLKLSEKPENKEIGYLQFLNE